MNSPIIFWYRQDLRVQDLPGLSAAVASGRPVIPCFILDDDAPGHWSIGGASRWWLHHSLQSLSADLANLGANLVLRRGHSGDELERLAQETGAEDIFCSRLYEPWAADLEEKLHNRFELSGLKFKRFGGTLLFEPEAIKTLGGQPYKVFTPFWRNCRAAQHPPEPRPLPRKTQWFDQAIDSEALAQWRLCPEEPNWAAKWSATWTPGSAGAEAKLTTFLEQSVMDYSEGRNFPALDTTSRLSAHLHFGEISPRTIWHRLHLETTGHPTLHAQGEKFLSELGWREFSHHLLHHFPDMSERAFKAPFQHFPWMANEEHLVAWQRGQTGYPLVDAGMRELWHTGYMHNRVRMIVASFLTKHLLIHWRRGADWFWDTLVDADLANNSCGWQWVAGSGADASPYFRIFNPTAQAKKFDGEGTYIRTWVPELEHLPNRFLNAPWEAPADVLEAAGISLGTHYPHPVVDHSIARKNALAAYASIREGGESGVKK